MRFAKPFAASIAAAIALAGVTATPARANDSDIVNFLAGATALAIIANAVNDHHDRVVVQHRYVYTPPRRVVTRQYVYVPPRRTIVTRQYVYTPPRRVIVTRPWDGNYHDARRWEGHHGDRHHGDNRWANSGDRGSHRPWVQPHSQSRVERWGK